MKWAPVISVRLPPAISANRYWRTRVMQARGKAPIVSTYVSADAKAFKEAVGWILRASGVRAPIPGRVRVDLQLWPHCPQDWRLRQRKDPLGWADTVQRIDLDNATKVLLDALTGVAIVDDKQVWKTTAEVMEPRADVAACVVLRICRAIPELHPQQDLDLPELLQPPTPQPRPEAVDPFDFSREAA